MIVGKQKHLDEIWDMIKGEFIEVIEWLDDSGDTLVWRFPDQDHAIKMGAKLTVRESQAAVFVNEGRIADVFAPGLYSLSTRNMPLMTTLESWDHGFNSPFKAEVYFVSTRNFLNLKWGTQNPIMMRDRDFGVVRLRAFGAYGIRITDPEKFVKDIVGTEGVFKTDGIEGQIRSIIASSFTGLMGRSDIAALDLAARYRELSDTIGKEMSEDFSKYGLQLTAFIIENISVPPEVEKMIDTRSQMGIAGDIGRYTQFQAAQAIPEAVRSGSAGDFVGMGAGIAVGQQVASAMASSLGAGQSPPAPPHEQNQPEGKFCLDCGKGVPPKAKFCPECGAAQTLGCPKCGAGVRPDAKFCQECGAQIR
ncbi:MAG: SPFH domain-containing protein [Pseudomonadota bacterium]